MKKFLVPPVLLLLAVLPAQAQSVKLPPTLAVPAPGLVTIVPESVDADDVAWVAMDAGLQLIPSSLLKNNTIACGVALQPGLYRVRAIAAKNKDGKATLSLPSECLVTVGAPGPQPPGPGPTPVPPVPPTPSVVPIDAPGLHVLIIEETAERAKLPASQLNVLTSKDVWAWLDAHCVVDTGGKNQKAAYLVDKDADASKWLPKYQLAMKRPRQSVPWIIISNKGKGKGYEGPLPATIDDTLKLLKQWGE